MPDGGGEHMQFTPGIETAREFREALGRYATGVTVVTKALKADQAKPMKGCSR